MNKSSKSVIISGDEVIFLGKPKNFTSSLSDYGMLKDGEVYVVHFETQNQLSLVGIPGLHSKILFEKI